MSRALVTLLLGLLTFASAAGAHEVRPAYLEIEETAPGRYTVLWRTPVLSGMRLPVALKLPDDVGEVGEPIVHSITLALATLGLVHVPGPPVEAMIALSILLLACEILRMRRGEESSTARWPWLVAFAFGLLHGFGFAGALTEVGLPQGDIPLALFRLQVGVELGQLAFIASVMLALAGAAFIGRRLSHLGIDPKPAYAASESVAAYAIGSVAAFWLIARTLGFIL